MVLTSLAVVCAQSLVIFPHTVCSGRLFTLAKETVFPLVSGRSVCLLYAPVLSLIPIAFPASSKGRLHLHPVSGPSRKNLNFVGPPGSLCRATPPRLNFSLVNLRFWPFFLRPLAFSSGFPLPNVSFVWIGTPPLPHVPSTMPVLCGISAGMFFPFPNPSAGARPGTGPFTSFPLFPQANGQSPFYIPRSQCLRDPCSPLRHPAPRCNTHILLRPFPFAPLPAGIPT